MDLDINTKGPLILFTVTTGFALCLSCCAFVFLVLTSNEWFLLRIPALPRFSLHGKDPLVLTLVGAIAFASTAACFSLVAQYVDGACNWGYKTAGAFYSLSYYCVNLFLLAKLRAVEAGLRATWYNKLQRAVSVATVFGMPCFLVVVTITMRGVIITGRQGVTFCKQNASPWLTITFLVLQAGASVAYLVLFIVPLTNTEKHVLASRSHSVAHLRGGKDKPHPVGFRAVIVRNLISCIGSVGMTFVCMTILTIASVSGDLVLNIWALSLTYIDLSINISSLLYALHPAWKSDRDSEIVHASTRREKDHTGGGPSKSTTELSGSGSFHPGNTRRLSSPPPAPSTTSFDQHRDHHHAAPTAAAAIANDNHAPDNNVSNNNNNHSQNKNAQSGGSGSGNSGNGSSNHGTVESGPHIASNVNVSLNVNLNASTDADVSSNADVAVAIAIPVNASA